MVGNACTHPKECYEATAVGNSEYFYDFMYKHAFYSDKDYTRFKGACSMGFQSELCQSIREELDKKFDDTNTNIYDLYAPCYYQYPTNPNKRIRSQKIYKSKLSYPIEDSDMDCDDSLGIRYFFNIPGMALHLHVDPIYW